MKANLSLSLILLSATTANAQIYDTLQYWPLDTYSEATIANLAADATHWTLNSKGKLTVPRDNTVVRITYEYMTDKIEVEMIH